jgi:hypothetical protein
VFVSLDAHGTRVCRDEELACSYRSVQASRRYVATLFQNIILPFDLDVNRKDYRGWYGLGQAYELLSMHQYALHYYQHATALRYAYLSRDTLRQPSHPT